MKVDSSSTVHAQQIATLLQKRGGSESVAQSLGTELHKLEKQLLTEWSKSPTEQNEGKIKSLELLYQKAIRAYSGFSRLMQNLHEILMEGIRALRVG